MLLHLSGDLVYGSIYRNKAKENFVVESSDTLSVIRLVVL
jgi:hypothetical protein